MQNRTGRCPSSVFGGRARRRRDTAGWLYLDLLRVRCCTRRHCSFRATSSPGLAGSTSRAQGQDLDYWLRLSRVGPIHRRGVPHTRRQRQPSPDARTITRRWSSGRCVDGISDPVGVAGSQRGRADLATSWFEFAYHHYQHGSLPVCRESAPGSEIPASCCASVVAARPHSLVGERIAT
jgi:hypothetical protein